MKSLINMLAEKNKGVASTNTVKKSNDSVLIVI